MQDIRLDTISNLIVGKPLSWVCLAADDARKLSETLMRMCAVVCLCGGPKAFDGLAQDVGAIFEQDALVSCVRGAVKNGSIRLERISGFGFFLWFFRNRA